MKERYVVSVADAVLKRGDTVAFVAQNGLVVSDDMRIWGADHSGSAGYAFWLTRNLKPEKDGGYVYNVFSRHGDGSIHQGLRVIDAAHIEITREKKNTQT